MNFSNYLRAQQLLDLGRYDEARAIARESLAANPDQVQMLSVLADAEGELGDTRGALETVERALALAPDDATYNAQRGYFLSTLNRHEDADESFVQALTYDPTNAYALAARVEAILRDPRSRKRKHKSERLGAARYCADTLLSNYPNRAMSHLMDSKVKLAQKDYDAAEQAAREALRVEPDNAIGHQLVGIAAEAKGETRKAGDAYVSAQRADPTSSTGIDGLRRLGKGAVAPIGFIGFLLLRTGARIGRAAGSVVVAVLVIAAVGALIYFLRESRKEQAASKVDLSPEARSILDQDDKFA